jgi:hypothetical protein
MSYDLAFWKQKLASQVQPSEIYRNLLDGKTVESLETIPTAAFIARVHQKFPGIIEDGGLVFWDGEKRGFFELYSSKQHVHFCCRQLSGDDMNALIDIAAEFDCRLYDPQTNQRYGGQEA